MAWITEGEMRDRLPREGDGISEDEISLAIASSVERVSGLTGHTAGDSALAQSAAANLAEAKLLDIIMPRDARDRESSQSVLRQSAADDITAYLDILRNSGGDADPRWSDVPPITITVTDPPFPAPALDPYDL